MSILSGRLTSSAGLGMAGGAAPVAPYPGNATSYPASSTGGTMGQGFIGQGQAGTSDIMSGKLTLAALEVLILGLVGFYIWTHKVQGGG